ncbi:MAG TPA: tetratricopeptide repeat protein, partial [Anaeromyxobacteraceae bacterium]
MRALRSAGAVLVAAIAAASAAAEKKPPEAALGAKRTAGPDPSLAGKLEVPRAEGPAGPRLEFEQFRYAVELQVSSKRQEEMRDLDKLIRLGGAPQEMPGWLFRLAELHWEEAQYLFFEANRRDDEIARTRDSAAAGRARAEKRQLEERQKAQQEEAIRLYKEVVRRFPDYPRLDEVVFFLGENLWRQQRRKEALEAYKALIGRFPKSRFVPDAWMAYGEYYFDQAEKVARNENLGKALESYKRAAARTESSVYGYALYKQGWVHYNLGAWAAALDLFRAVILFGELPTSTVAPEKKIALVREARKDYVRTYSHVGSPQTAAEEFKRVGGDPGWKEMLASLAALYFEEGKDREAALVYHHLVQLEPLGPQAPLYQSRIVTAAGRLGRKDLTVQQAQRFVKMLRDFEAAGAGKDAPGAKGLAAARAEAENVLRTLAVNYHQEWRKTRDEPVAGYAAQVYAAYLEVFPAAPHSYDMRFFHAELLFAQERWQEAGDEYSRVAAQDAEKASRKPPAPGKYFSAALEAAVHAYDVVAKRAEGPRRAAGDVRKPQPLTRERKQLVDACLQYLRFTPRGAKRVEVAYKAADVYYRHNQFPEAVRLFSGVALESPEHELAAYAANLVLDCANLQGDWRAMNDWARRFWQEEALLRAHPPLRADLARVIEQSTFKLVEPLEKERRHAEAAEAYLSFAQEWPASALAATALYNASVDLSLAGQPARALEVRDRLLRAFPSDPLAAKVILANARDHEAAGDFAEAAEAYERYFAGWRAQQARARAAKAPARAAARGRKPAPEPPPAAAPGPYEEARAQDALHDAGVLREGLSQPARAEADRTLFVETWPQAPEAPRVFLSIADLHARAGNRDKEVRQLQEYQQRWAQAPAEWLAVQARIARSLERAGNADAARKARAAALAFHRQRKLTPAQAGERGMPVVAAAMLDEVEPAFAAWDRITLDVKPRYLKSQLELKGKRLLQLEARYGEVVQTKQAEAAVCALTRIGALYARFARALVEAPVPREIRGQKELVREYRSQLAGAAEAPQGKAAEGMEIALAKSRELGVRNACTREAEAFLAKARPDKHGPVLEKLPEVAAPGRRERAVGYGLIDAPRPREARAAPPPARPPPALAIPAPPAAAPGPDRPPAEPRV